MRFRYLMLIIGVVLAVAVAATGCGDESKHAEVVGGPGVSYIPRTSLAYLIVDTHFDRAAWRQLNAAAKRVPIVRDARSVLLDVAGAGTYRYSRNFMPWIGKHGGLALLDTSANGQPAHAVFFFESRNDAAAMKLLRTPLTQPAASIKGRKVYRNGFGNYMLADDGIVLVGNSRTSLKRALEAHDNHTSMASSVSANRAAARVHDGAVVTLVTSKRGYRLLHGSDIDRILFRQSVLDSAASFSGTSGFRVIQSFLGQVTPAGGGTSPLQRARSITRIAAADRHASVTAMALGIDPSPQGLHVRTAAISQTTDTGSGRHYEPSLVNAVPANIVALYDNTNLGTVIDPLMRLAGVTSIKDYDPLNGEFAIAMGAGSPRTMSALALVNGSGTNDAVQQLMDQVPAMGGTVSRLDPNGLRTVQLRGQKVIVKRSDSLTTVAASRAAASMFSSQQSLADSPVFTRIVEASGMPRRVGGMFFIDTQRALASAQFAARDDLTGLGPVLGWFSASGSVQQQELFISMAGAAA